jgi:hypothetical protein
MVRRKPPAGTAINWGHPLSNALVGCFPMNEGSGSRIRDLVSGVIGVLSGSVLPTWQGGPDGFSLKFAGGVAANSYIDCGANSQLTNLGRLNNSGGPIGASFFFRAMWDGAASTGGLAERNDNNSVNAGWIVGFNSAGTMMCLREFSTTNERDTFTAPTAGQWFDIVVTFDGAIVLTGPDATYAKVYIDGRFITLARPGQANGTSGSDAANTFYIGRETFQAAGSWNGLISTAMFWRRALSQQEAQILHEDPWAVLRYPDDDIFSQTVTQTLDASMATFDATLTKQTNHVIAAAMATFSGALNGGGQFVRTITAGMATFSGEVFKRTSHVIGAGMSTFDATLSTLRTAFGTFNASMATFSGSLSRQTNKVLTAGTSTFSATLNKLTTHVFNAAMATFAATISGSRLKFKVFTAAMSQFSGALVRRTGKGLTAGMGTFSATLTTVFIPTGNLVTINAGMSTFAGALSRQTNKTLGAASMALFSGSLSLIVTHGGVPTVCTPANCDNDPNLISHIEPCDNPGS